jgi:hypothetical protein
MRQRIYFEYIFDEAIRGLDRYQHGVYDVLRYPWGY